MNETPKYPPCRVSYAEIINTGQKPNKSNWDDAGVFIKQKTITVVIIDKKKC